ncbi:uncharacterized protein H6S33_011239 [Morchella sextelata]|uniref:uncharacterized protein n=1 Tax=Morchella sextelata TaxID=1174677 RepID=UPI001D049E40|nr:uncharacterized protein H6S33_011239 [Morchella sextelata]KAH0610812.1 hypothetical protein H6S33_011239 [Morchella sextelata]
MSLPTPRHLLSTLLTTLHQQHPTPVSPDPNTLHTLPPSSQDLLLTLSHLLPSTLLPALDLLDHRRVHRCRPAPHSKKYAYFVSSSSSATVHVVRPAAWWCSCGAFAWAAFGRRGAGGEAGEVMGTGEEGGLWGGRMRGEGDVPVCVHLVACVLVEGCPGLFGGYVQEEQVALERWVEIELERR